ncbi:MAG: hypothetical protein LAT58_12725, partial [Opitutales bacterium]|nr:hypothetical protein [Opitutales bacterium]
WGKEVLREYRMLLLGQAGGDGAKEEMAELLSAREGERTLSKGDRHNVLKVFTRGIVMGTRGFVENCYKMLGMRKEIHEISEEFASLSVGQKQFRERGSYK